MTNSIISNDATYQQHFSTRVLMVPDPNFKCVWEFIPNRDRELEKNGR